MNRIWLRICYQNCRRFSKPPITHFRFPPKIFKKFNLRFLFWPRSLRFEVFLSIFFVTALVCPCRDDEPRGHFCNGHGQFWESPGSFGNRFVPRSLILCFILASGPYYNYAPNLGRKSLRIFWGGRGVCRDQKHIRLLSQVWIKISTLWLGLITRA